MGLYYWLQMYCWRVSHTLSHFMPWELYRPTCIWSQVTCTHSLRYRSDVPCLRQFFCHQEVLLLVEIYNSQMHDIKNEPSNKGHQRWERKELWVSTFRDLRIGYGSQCQLKQLSLATWKTSPEYLNKLKKEFVPDSPLMWMLYICHSLYNIVHHLVSPLPPSCTQKWQK